MQFKSLKWLMMLVMALLLVGCTTAEKADETKKQTGYTVKDDSGQEVQFEQVPEKIVSLMPSNTEIIYALGEGQKVVGVTEYCTFPEEAIKVEKIGSQTGYNVERIVQLKPDVVFAYVGLAEEALKQLQDAGLKVVVVNTSAESISYAYKNIELIAKTVQKEDEATKLIADIKAKIEEVKEKVAGVKEPKNMYYEVAPAPSIWTAGSKTFQQDLFEIANVKNVFADQQSWVQVSEEQVIKKNPEVILTSVEGEDNLKGISTRDGWKDITAVKNSEVYYVQKDVVSRPGPRIGEAAEVIAKTVYPELFK